MATTISDKAIASIQKPQRDPLVDPTGYAEELDGEAFALQHLLRSKEITDISDAYKTANARALKAQYWFRWLAWGTAYAGLAAAVLGGLLFYLSALKPGRPVENVVWAVQIVCLGAAFLGPLVLKWGGFLTAWRGERVKAESKRSEFYKTIVAASSPGATTDALFLSLKLECFRRHLLDGQIDYFGRTADRMRKVATRWSVGRVVAMVLVGAAFVAPVLSLADGIPWLPKTAKDFLVWIPHTGEIERKGYWLLALVGGYLQGFFTLAALLEPAERNAEEFTAMSRDLTSWRDKALPGARTRAALADQGSVDTFTQWVFEALARETSDWETWYLVREEIARKLMTQSKTAPPVGGPGI